MEKIRNLRGKKLTSNWREGYDNLIRLKSSFFVADKTSYLSSRLHIVLCLNRFKSLIKHLNYVITTESFVNEGSKFFVKKMWGTQYINGIFCSHVFLFHNIFPSIFVLPKYKIQRFCRMSCVCMLKWISHHLRNISSCAV